MEDWQKQLLNNVSNRKKQNYVDTLKQSRLAEEETRKASPEYKETQQKDRKAKKLKADRLLKEEQDKLIPESGTEAIDRLLTEIKTARGNVYSSGKPISKSDFPKPIEYEEWMTSGLRADPSRKAYARELGTPLPDTASEIGVDRIKELKGQLKTAKYAKDENIPFDKAVESAPVRKAYKSKVDDLAKMLNQPGVDPRKVRYLMKLQSNEWLKRNYPGYSVK